MLQQADAAREGRAGEVHPPGADLQAGGDWEVGLPQIRKRPTSVEAGHCVFGLGCGLAVENAVHDGETVIVAVADLNLQSFHICDRNIEINGGTLLDDLRL